MTITPFGWHDLPAGGTALDAANLEASLAHAGAYTDAEVAGILVPPEEQGLYVPVAGQDFLGPRPNAAISWRDDLLNIEVIISEQQVQAMGGEMSNDALNIVNPSVTADQRAQIVPGAQGGARTLMRAGSTAGQMMLPSEGMLPQDEFTFVLPIRFRDNDPAASDPPTLTTNSSGGTMTAGTYGAVVTYVNAAGECCGSRPASIAVSGAQQLVVHSPPTRGDATGWYAYVTAAGGSTYNRQQAAGSPVALGTNLTLSANPVSTHGTLTVRTWNGFAFGRIVCINEVDSFQSWKFQCNTDSNFSAQLHSITSATDVTSVSTSSQFTMVPGDFPADTVSQIAVSYDQTNGLVVTAGVNYRNVPANNGAPLANGIVLPWSGDGMGIAKSLTIGHYNDLGYDVGVPVIGRRSNAAAFYAGPTFRTVKRPAITVSAGTTAGAFPRNVGGVVDKLPNSTETSFDLTDANTLAILDFLADSDCPLVRIPEINTAAPIVAFLSGNLSTGAPITTLPATALKTVAASSAITVVSGTHQQTFTSPGASNGASSIPVASQTPNFAYPSGSVIVDFTLFDQWVNAFLTRGMSVHGMIGYTPAALQSTPGNEFSLPTSNTQFALWASAIVGRYKLLTTQAANGTALESIVFWNEPDNVLTWTTGQFAAVWQAAATRINLDFPGGPSLDPPDGTVYNTTYQIAVLAAAQTAGLPIAAQYVHDYGGQPGHMLVQVAQVKTQLASYGYTSAKCRVTEWGFDAFYMSLEASFPNADGTPGYAHTLPVSFTPNDGAHAHAQLVELANAGVDIATNFTPDGFGFPGFWGWVVSNGANPRFTSRAYAMRLFWKHTGSLIEVDTNHPGLRAIGSLDTINGKAVITVSYSLFRSGAFTNPLRVEIEYPTGLPTSFTWKRWEISDEHPDREVVIAIGEGSTLPSSVVMRPRGYVGAIQITER